MLDNNIKIYSAGEKIFKHKTLGYVITLRKVDEEHCWFQYWNDPNIVVNHMSQCKKHYFKAHYKMVKGE